MLSFGILPTPFLGFSMQALVFDHIAIDRTICRPIEYLTNFSTVSVDNSVGNFA